MDLASCPADGPKITGKAEAHTEVVDGPKAFAPPAPPTPEQEADGRITIYYRIGIVVGLAAAVFGLVRAWDMIMIGGLCVAGACFAGLWLKANQTLVAVIIGFGVALKFAGPYIWNRYLKPKTNEPVVPNSTRMISSLASSGR